MDHGLEIKHSLAKTKVKASFGKRKKLLLLSPHGADHTWLLKTFPDLDKDLNDDYLKYVRIEQDYGANLVAHYIIEDLTKTVSMLRLLRLFTTEESLMVEGYPMGYKKLYH